MAVRIEFNRVVSSPVAFGILRCCSITNRVTVHMDGSIGRPGPGLLADISELSQGDRNTEANRTVNLPSNS